MSSVRRILRIVAADGLALGAAATMLVGTVAIGTLYASQPSSSSGSGFGGGFSGGGGGGGGGSW
jgi:hypothetical protein